MNRFKDFFKRFGTIIWIAGGMIAVAVVLGLLSTCSGNEGTIVDMFK